MSRFTLPRPIAVVPLATFESMNDPKVITPADSTLALLDIPDPDAKRPPFDWDTGRPEVDPSVRGWPAVGMTQGRSIQVLLRRVDLDAGAKLELWSSDPSLLAPGIFDQAHEALVNLIASPPPAGTRRAAPHLVRIEARWNGQLVAGLAVYVHSPLRVKLHVHEVVSVQGTKTGEKGKFPSITDALVFSNAIWAQAGIELLLDGITPLPIPVKHEPDFQNDDDRDEARRKHSLPGVVNVFLFDRSRPDHPHPGSLGDTHGLSLLDKPDFGPPFLFLNSRNPVLTGVNTPDVTFWENPKNPDRSMFSRTLSHELGHFFTLTHPVFLDDERVAWVGIGRLLMCPGQPSASLIPSGFRDSIHGGVTLEGSTLAREKILHYRFDV